MAQDNWRWCSRCQGLWFAGNSYQGRCLTGSSEAHLYWGSGNYALESASDFPEGQSNWRFCRKCAGIFYAGNVTSEGRLFLGHCPAGGSHDPSASGDYAIGSRLGPTTAGTPQDNWRYCRNCALMFYAGNSNGRCSAPGRPVHDPSASGDYKLAWGPTSNAGSAVFIVTWQSFNGQLQDDCDHIEVTFQDNPGSPGLGVYTLEAGPGITFWKGLKLVSPPHPDQTIETEGDHLRPSRQLTCPTEEFHSATLVLGKGKVLGFHTDMYRVSSLNGTEGKIVHFRWVRDRC